MESNLLNPGPARRDDGEQTRERLLDAAEERFAAQGFHGTSIRDIVDDAGCNIAAVNYHFRGKENLYYEVMQRRLRVLREVRLEQIRSMMEDEEKCPDLQAVLSSYAQAFLEPVAERSSNRHLFQLFSRELLDPHISPDLLLSELVEPVQRALVQAIDAACPGIDPDDLKVCVQLFVAQLVHLLHMQTYFGSERCSRLSFSLSTHAVERVVQFSTAGMCSMMRLDGGKCAGPTEG